MITLTSGASASPAQANEPIAMASFWRRWAAYFIDSIILAVADSLVGLVLGTAPPAVSPASSLSNSAVDFTGIWQVASAVIHLAVPALYFICAYSSGGQTIGKAILRVKVVSIDGSPLTWRNGILRTLGYVPSSLLFGLGFLSSIWDKDKQTWHDKIAGTCVVRAAVPREALLGRIEPNVARLRQRSWLVVLGIVTALAFVVLGLLVPVGVSQVAEMGPWPGRDVRPEQVAALDLAHLGLTTAQVKDARTSDKWVKGQYVTGAIVIYTAGQQEIVAITALQYSDMAAAASDFRSLTESAKENCRWYAYANSMNTGAIRCGLPGGFDQILRSGYWILDIVALDGGPFPAQDLADKVRDAVAAGWKQAQESRR